MAASKRPLAKKLGIKDCQRLALLHSPKGYSSILGSLPASVELTTRLAGEKFDLVQAFYTEERALKSELRKLAKAIVPAGSVWVCWRKGGVTGLSRDSIAELAERSGLEGVATCAIDDSWSALRLMRPKNKRL